jgi:acetoin utilization protein AcuB
MRALVKKSMSTPILTVRWGDKVKAAQVLMKRHKIRHLPVVDEKGFVVGILSDRDIQRALRSTISLDDAGTGMYSERAELDPEALVRQYMSWPAKEVAIDDDLRLVARKMVADKISAVLVRDKNRIVGIVTSEDLLRVLAEVLALIDQPSSWSLAGLVEQSLERLGGTGKLKAPVRRRRR